MRDALLYVLSGLVPVLLVIAAAHRIYRDRHPLDITISEWLERMRKLDEEHPIKQPRFLSRYASTGKAGVSTPESVKQSKKLSVVKKKTAAR
jgi:pilus assembly protein TadC